MKKRHNYGTVMVDIESHRIVDMIPSREAGDVKQWLKAYPNISVVSRDGSTTYRNAITEALPEAVQVSDRFHLIKNLVDYSKDYLRKELSTNIKIAATNPEKQEIAGLLSRADENRKLTRKEKYGRINALAGLGYGKSAICKELNMDVRAYDKLLSATPDELEKKFGLKKTKKHEENLKRKQRLIEEVCELKKSGLSATEISRRTGISRKTTLRYLNPEFNPVHALYGEKRDGLLTPFLQEVDNMLSRGVKSIVIESTIRDKGYSGSSSSVRQYISDWKNNRKQDFDKTRLQAGAIEIVERKNLFKLLYHPLENVKDITEAQLEAVNTKYPEFANIHSIVWEFKEIFKLKDINVLPVWIEKANALGITEINSFIAGIKKDADAVNNAVALPYSNGLAEGSVNKLKVIKRIMYGRCGFETFRAKTLKLEKLRNDII